PYRRAGGVNVGAAGFQHLIAVNQVGKRFFNEMRVTQQLGSSEYPQNGAIKKWNEYVQGDWRNCKPDAVKAVYNDNCAIDAALAKAPSHRIFSPVRSGQSSIRRRLTARNGMSYRPTQE